MTCRFNPPPNWPAPPTADWTPPPGWKPNPAWGPAPDGWSFWTQEAGTAPQHKKSHPVLTLVLLALAVLFTFALGMSQSDREIVSEDPDFSATSSLVTMWSFTGVTLVAIVLAAIRPRSRNVRILILTLAVPLLAGTLLSTVRLDRLSDSGFTELGPAALAACHGDPVVGAATVAGSPALLILDEKGSSVAWDSVQDRAWGARSLEELQIVVCVGDEKPRAVTCEYTNGFSYEITHLERSVRVVAASDASLLDETVLSGETPGCYARVRGDPDDEQGEPVADRQIIDYLTEVLD